MELLLNWFVHGAFIVAATAVGLRVLPASRPQARYCFLWVACLLVLALPVVSSLLAAASADGQSLEIAPLSAVAMPAGWWTSSAVPIALWSVWFSFHAVRLFAETVAIRAVKRKALECPPGILARLPCWPLVSTTGRPVSVVLSHRVRFAAVLGGGSPAIALAPAVVEQLTSGDLDRVLIHEWTHVQRRDDLAQVVQQVIRMLVGWHPAVWWLDRQLELEREAACDQVVVCVTGSARAYATCLLTLAALPRTQVRSLAGVAVSSSWLRVRIARILGAPDDSRVRPWRVLAFSSGLALVACAVGVTNVRFVTLLVPSPLPVAAVQTAGLRAQDAYLPGIRRVTAPVPAATAASPRLPRSLAHARAATRAIVVQRAAIEPRSIDSSSTTQAVPAPIPSTSSVDPQDSALAGRAQDHALGAHQGETPTLTLDSHTEPYAADKARSPWRWAADSGLGIGRAAQAASVTTAGFFSRFGKKLARSF